MTNIERVYLCTSKNSKLYKIHMLNTGDEEKREILKVFEGDLEKNLKNEPHLPKLKGNALIDDLAYFVEFSKIDENKDNYLMPFKAKIEELLENPSVETVKFKKGKVKREDSTKSLEAKEGIKFLIVQDDKSLYFLSISRNSILKNKTILNCGMTNNAVTVKVPRGIQIPPTVTARLNREDKKLFVYDVNQFETMLTLNEHQKAKSKAVINKFIHGEYTISSYKIKGLTEKNVTDELYSSARAVRRLSKYSQNNSNYPIEKVKEAVSHLENDELKVEFDDENNQIIVKKENVKTFVAIIHDSIVKRLISGEVELTM